MSRRRNINSVSRYSDIPEVNEWLSHPCVFFIVGSVNCYCMRLRLTCGVMKGGLISYDTSNTETDLVLWTI